MKRLLFLLCLPAFGATFYISKSTGMDTRTSGQAQSKATPWAHLPGMVGATSNAAARVPVAGDQYIFMGGDTWVNGDLGIDWEWSGSSGSRIYVGADKTWFSGGSWVRPKFDCQTTNCGTSFFGNVLWIAGNFTTFDNVEWTGYQQTGQLQLMAAFGNSNEIENFYVHGWSRTAGSSAFNTFVFTNNTSSGGGQLTLFHDNVIDGSDSPDQDFMGGVLHGYSVYNNVIRYVYNNNGGFNDVHGNLIENNFISPSGDHCNMFFFQGPVATDGWFYNNIMRHTGCGSTLFMFSNSSCTNCTGYVYNNIFYDTDVSPEAITSGGHVATFQYVVYNNTIVANHCMGNGDSGGGGASKSTTHYENNQCITGGLFCDGTGTTCVNDGGNLQQTAAVATAVGYTSSQTPYVYAPTSAGSPTVGAGTNLTASCSGNLAALCSDIAYATYNTIDHTVVMRSVNARPGSGAWDSGAYEFMDGATGGGSSSLGASKMLGATVAH